jgi:ring-1,2-phenylacetyl-CoA epoxidase subunit PaaC
MTAAPAPLSAASPALAELLLTLADDEFVIGYWDSEWTGIAPYLEEDVAMSSLSQDEIGHARLFYERLARETGDSADRIAYGRPADGYRHARLLDHPRNDWAFTIARRYLYETADSVRLAALASGSDSELSDSVAKIRREERYHLMHVDAWLRRLADAGREPRTRLEAALRRLWPDASSVFAGLETEASLLEEGLIGERLDRQRERWLDEIGPVFRELALPFEPASPSRASRGPDHGPDFAWLWGEFTSVYRSEPGATW